MAWWEREYSRSGWSATGFRSHRLAIALTVVHVAAFVALLVGPSAWTADGLSPLGLSGFSSPPIGILSHAIASARLGDLTLVLFGVWTVGRIVESRIGWRMALAQYGLGVGLGGAVYFLLVRLWPQLGVVPLVFPAGAMAAWSLSAWRVIDGEQVRLIRWEVSQRLVLGGLAGLVVLITVAGRGGGALAWMAAVAVAGLAAPLSGWMAEFGSRWNESRRRARPVAAERRPARLPSAPRPPLDASLDELLAKIGRDGIESLTPTERARLEAARQELLRKP